MTNRGGARVEILNIDERLPPLLDVPIGELQRDRVEKCANVDQ
jgi:hypothetical protein